MRKIFLLFICAFLGVASTHSYAMDDNALRDKLKTFLDGDREGRVGAWLYAQAALKFPSLPLPERLHEVARRLTLKQRAMLREGPEQIRDLFNPEKKVGMFGTVGFVVRMHSMFGAIIYLNYRKAFDLIMEVVLTPSERSTVIEMRDDHGHTALLMALGHLSGSDIYNRGDGFNSQAEYFVRQLLEYGACVAVNNIFGWTPLHFAQTPEMVRMLVAHGAGISINKLTCCRIHAQTPLHRAVHSDQLSLAQALLKSGASPLTQDETGITPLDYAYDGGNEQMIQLLKNSVSEDANTEPSDALRRFRGISDRAFGDLRQDPLFVSSNYIGYLLSRS